MKTKKHNKKNQVIISVILIGLLFFNLSLADDNLALNWNTFSGSVGHDYVSHSAVDNNGNIYLIGRSNTSWGSPINSHSGGGGDDILIVKLNKDAQYQWHTFFGAQGSGTADWFSGSEGYDQGLSIAVDRYGDIYFSGYSATNWGNALSGSYSSGIVIGKLNSNGGYLWHQFTNPTTNSYNISGKIYLDQNSNVIVTGHSNSSWGAPINPFNGGVDSVIAKYSSEGRYLWHSFIGGESNDWAGSVVSDPDGNIFMAGGAYASWTSCGTPKNAHSSISKSAISGLNDENIVVAKFDPNGYCQWHTFLGGSEADDTVTAYDLTLDVSGNIYTAGISYRTWGSPINAHSGLGYNSNLTKLNNEGDYLWHTFQAAEWSGEVTTDIVANVYLTDNLGITKYNSSGSLQWKSTPEVFSSINLSSQGNILLSGTKNSSWAEPVTAYTAGMDIGLAEYKQLDCAANCASLALAQTPLATTVSSASGGAVHIVQKAYLAYYGRPGDPEGVDYWAKRLDGAGGSWSSEIIMAFGASEEFQARFGNLSTSALIDNIYQQLFNRIPDLAGLAYFSELLDSGQSSLAEIAVIILNGAIREDSSIINHKIITANYFTQKISSSGSYGSIDDAKVILSSITSNPDSIVSAFGIIEGF